MFLRKGDLVDVICPASSITKNSLRQIKNFLTRNGLEARFHMENELLMGKKQPHLFPSFSAEKRFAQLLFALENQESKAIWCVRGGYGSGDLIPYLNTIAKPTQNKLFIGFSDITSLAIFLQTKWDLKIIYGPMLSQLATDSVAAKSKKELLDLIFGRKIELRYEVSGPHKSVEAPIVGGCLSVVAAHFATSNQIDWSNKILFLEDIDESGEKIDRYFMQIIQAILHLQSTPQAILLGNFSYGIKELNKKQNINYAIAHLSKRLQDAQLNIPVFVEKSHCLGHAKNIMPIVVGGTAKISGGNLVQKSVCIF